VPLMYAQLEFNLCNSSKTKLVVYRRKKDATDDDAYQLISFDLTNEQLTELVIVAKIKPVDMNK
jgi:hypothetical protein